MATNPISRSLDRTDNDGLMDFRFSPARRGPLKSPAKSSAVLVTRPNRPRRWHLMIIHYGDDRTKLSCRDISECLCGGMDGIDINDLPCDVSLCWGQTETVRRALNPWVSYEACGTACESQRMRQAFWQTTQQTDNQPVERIYIETVNGLSIFQIWTSHWNNHQNDYDRIPYR